jgi:predicted HTH transcriptional regulator
MTKTELLEIIKNGENSGIEYKRDTIKNHTLARELVAFANLDGGRIFLGIEDDGTVSGITRSNIEEWVMTTCRDKIRPEGRHAKPGTEQGRIRTSISATRRFSPGTSSPFWFVPS